MRRLEDYVAADLAVEAKALSAHAGTERHRPPVQHLLGKRNAEQRLAAFLLGISERFARLQSDGVLSVRRRLVELKSVEALRALASGSPHGS